MVGKRLVNTGGAAGAAAFDPLQNFETVTYTGNGGTQKITGYIRKGAAFNGSSSYIDTSVSVLPADNYTVSMWVYHNSLKNSCALYTQYRGTVTGRHIVNSNANGGIQINTSSTNSLSSITATPFTTNTWQHLVVTKSSTSGYVVYIDGSSIGSWSNTDNIITDQSTQFGGDTEWSGDHWLNGKIDQVRIFDKALSSSEVTTLYGETYADPKKSTTDFFGDGSGVALYELDEDANDTGGGTSIGQTGIFNGSNSRVEIPNNTVNFSNAHTISLWCNPDTLKFAGLFTQYTTYHANICLTADGGIVLAGGSSTAALGTSAGTIAAGSWSNVIAVNAGGTTTYDFYVNGVSVGSASCFAFSGRPTSIGSNASTSTSFADYFDGKIDEVRVYSSALNSTDIGYIADNDTANIPTSTLAAHYKFEGNVLDSAGSFNGTATSISYGSWSYDGTPTNVNFLGMAFQPDLVWTKSYAGLNWWHFIQDSVRGTTSALFSNRTDAAGTFTDAIQSFDSNGYTIGSTGSLNYDSSNSYVAWCFKAGGAASLNENGSIDSQVSANQDAGFSIVKYTSTSGGNHSVGHGLGVTPEMIIVKRVDTTGEWYVFYNVVDGSWDYMTLNTTNAKADFDTFNATNNTTFYSGPASSGETYINYCFHSVDGYQKVGSYSGTGAVNNQINVGFQPRFVMQKRSDSTGSWNIIDNLRGDDNYLSANLANTEGSMTASSFHLTSTGFTLDNSFSEWNASGGTYIYLAIA